MRTAFKHTKACTLEQYMKKVKEMLYYYTLIHPLSKILGTFPSLVAREISGREEGKGDRVPLVDMMAERRRVYKEHLDPESAKHLRE